MYFSEDGKNVQVRQYSTVRERYLGSDSQTTFTVDTARAAVLGDINNDAVVDARDIVVYKKYVALIKDMWIDTYTSDLDGNGEFNIADVTALRNMILEQ